MKINPFSFPTEIHVLEHIDRLVEIFNACWPMYSAMPAVMKDAILNAYEGCGWDLDESLSDDKILPTFEDVLDQLNIIMDRSQYSDEIKSNYKGALSTRLESLTKGLIGKIFSEDEIGDEKLFEENVIVDLSRVGSSETKSLIMGILFLKLNEYRISTGGMNLPLKHIAVLEEAHHLLPRTSKESSSESGNIKGKAVEMLSNAIAEMRTYGEGFVIVDQSPNMLDVSAIRNTNTKIIMRLSELEDRNDIGKSVALTDDQINEIPRLARGVAVVYQNGWEEAVLCSIEKGKSEQNKEGSKEEYKYEKYLKKISEKEIISTLVGLLVLGKTSIHNDHEELLKNKFKDNSEEYEQWAPVSSYKRKIFEDVDNYLSNMISIDTKRIARHVSYLLKGKKIYSEIKKEDNDFSEQINYVLKDKIDIFSKEYMWQVAQYIKIDNAIEQERLLQEFNCKMLDNDFIKIM